VIEVIDDTFAIVFHAVSMCVTIVVNFERSAHFDNFVHFKDIQLAKLKAFINTRISNEFSFKTDVPHVASPTWGTSFYPFWISVGLFVLAHVVIIVSAPLFAKFSKRLEIRFVIAEYLFHRLIYL